VGGKAAYRRETSCADICGLKIKELVIFSTLMGEGEGGGWRIL
jgi:hypothetical protein